MTPSRPFPSLLISAHRIEAQGAFAEAQAAFLEPDPATGARLRAMTEDKGVGIVAHYYMDPELQGILAASGLRHIHISDSLVMADRAVDMAAAGARSIVVLGVDFMAENVRAVLDAAGYGTIPVYRVAREPIGCSLAEAADTQEYLQWLQRARSVGRGLHVVYINTSLATKAYAHATIPTITCTSSNVVSTVLAAFAQIPEIKLWFGPDTYMGQNLRVLFESLRQLDDTAIRAIHPAHDRTTLSRIVAGFDYYPRGNCIVHHLFGDEVARRVANDYADALITAHLEVPSAMFQLGLTAQQHGRGVVGSTSDILGFAARAVESALARAQANSPQANSPTANSQTGKLQAEKLRLVLGTESGMVTSLVRKIQSILRTREDVGLTVEIVFPVADEAVTRTGDVTLPIVPGPAGGDGCSIEGGCATCPYMKMNSLDALFALLARIDGPSEALQPFAPRMRSGEIKGRPLLDWATEPIRSMREFTRLGKLPQSLIDDVRSRAAS